MQDDKNMQLTDSLIGISYREIAEQSLNSFAGKVRNLLAQRRLPDDGFKDMEIEHLLMQISAMDTNNFEGKIGIGEREGRVYSSLVEKRHYYMSHGIGRSGTMNAVQPKAPGSSLILQLTRALILDVLRNILSLNFVEDVLVVPSATGMSLTLSMLALSKIKPNAKYVIWPRIDQKTCIKSITAAGLIPVVIDETIEGDALGTDMVKLKSEIDRIGIDNILAVFSTTSCFAPRVPDKVDLIAEVCKERDLFHIVNNAYGLQCTKICSMLVQANQKGRVDLVIQSTDKNFMVPVGGSIIFSKDEKLLEQVSKLYPGRASMSPVMDMFITLLSMGRNGLKLLLKERKENYAFLVESLKTVLEKKGERILETSTNKISVAFTIGNIIKSDKFKNDATFFGSYLFKRRVMGSRVVSTSTSTLEGIKFSNYGSHHENYPHLPYITVASAIGSTKKEIQDFIQLLSKIN